MGLRLELFIVNEFELARILGDPECHPLRVVAERCADFSLHLVPHDLDYLSEEIGECVALPQQKLRANLTCLVDKPEYGAMLVDNEWVNYVAAVPENNVEAIVENWARRMQIEHKNPQIKATSDMRTAVANLVTLCVVAKKESRPVFHRWAL